MFTATPPADTPVVSKKKGSLGCDQTALFVCHVVSAAMSSDYLRSHCATLSRAPHQGWPSGALMARAAEQRGTLNCQRGTQCTAESWRAAAVAPASYRHRNSQAKTSDCETTRNQVELNDISKRKHYFIPFKMEKINKLAEQNSSAYMRSEAA